MPIFVRISPIDKHIIRALYMASMAGVRIRLLIRGICCLRPGIPSISENISVTSIVGRFLEHARAFWFSNGGEGLLYIGSADLMPRNLDRRVEVLTPILHPALRRSVRECILEWQLQDNEQAWRMETDGSYSKVKPAKDDVRMNAQEKLLEELPSLNAAMEQ